MGNLYIFVVEDIQQNLFQTRLQCLSPMYLLEVES